VLFERKPDPDVLKRHETSVSSFGLDANTPREEILKKAESIAENEKVLKIELRHLQVGGKLLPLLRITRLGRDKARVAGEKQWREYAMKNLARGKDVAGFALKTLFASLSSGYIFFDEFGAIGRMTENYEGPKGEPVGADVLETRRQTISAHQFLRSIIREDCALEETKFGWVIRSRDKWAKTSEGGKGHGLSWLSGERRAVYIVSVGGEPDGLLPLYIERFPSSLTRDFKIDKTAWGREEMEFWLTWMKKAVEIDDPDAARRKLTTPFGQVGRYVFLPMLEGTTTHDASLSDLKQRYALVAEWWEKHKGDTYWHESLQKLVARGWSPEELSAAARRRIEAEKQARLDAPLTEEKLQAITAGLIQRMERRWAERVESNKKSFGADCGAKLEKVAEGVWKLAWKQSKPGPLIVDTITGPTLERREGSKRFPLKATFTKRYYDDLYKKVVSYDEAFYYDKLEETWARKPEPEESQ